MGRPRKSYEVEALPHSLGSPHSAIVRFESGLNQVQKYDFTGVEPVACATALATAFRYHDAASSGTTRKTTSFAIRRFCEFLRATGRSVPTEIDTQCVSEFIDWLDAKYVSTSSRRSIWSRVRQLLRWLATTKPDWSAPDLVLPFGPFTGTNRGTAMKRVLPRSDMERILKCAREEVECVWRQFQVGQDLLRNAEPIGRRPNSSLNLDDLGTLLRLLVERYGGRPPISPDWRLKRAIALHGGLAGISRYLFATPDALAPYLLLVGAQAFANTHALVDLRRDCLTDHLLFEHRVVLTWEKGRSSRVQRRSFLRRQRFGVPDLIEQLRALTEPLLTDLPLADREFLFVARFLNQPRGTRRLTVNAMSYGLSRFAERNELRGPDGEFLRINPSVTRATGLNLAHEAFGGDITKTMMVANHASIETTRRYVAQPSNRAKAELELTKLQKHFIGTVQQDLRDAPKLDAPAHGANASASGFNCRDPFSGAGPGQVEGKICTAWLGCFTCPNAVVPINAEVLARLEATRDALLKAKMDIAPARWDLLYGPKLMILEREILPHFPSRLAVDAASMRSNVPAIPPIE